MEPQRYRDRGGSWVANATPHPGHHRSGGASSPEAKLVQPFVFFLLRPDVLPNHRLVSSHRRHGVPSRPEVLPHEVALPLPIDPCQMNRALALDEPNHLRHAYFGGIDTSMWTWSAIRWPSSTRRSFCAASLRNTSPRCTLSCPYSTFRRHFGMNTTWNLHSHAVWRISA